jgi:FtsP/CotA-like multicopper oxidase with cupredoxin domain
MTPASTNLHFHGLNISPTCHQDEVIHTLVQPGQTFDYQIPIPVNEPSGLYWYHPHAHGLSDAQVNGGATGAIVVEGIQEVFPALAGFTERTFLLRDQMIPALSQNPNDGNEPSWDISVNYVPILYPAYQPALIETESGMQEFWRVVNSAADTIFNLQVLSNGEAQTVQVYAIDGVPVPGGPLPSRHSLCLQAPASNFSSRRHPPGRLRSSSPPAGMLALPATARLLGQLRI